MSEPWPEELRLAGGGSELVVRFDTGESHVLAAEYLRVESPSAEVQGHAPSQKVLVAGKADVAIDAIEPVGQYGVLLRFSDGHATGIFSWDVLHRLGREYDTRWPAYLDALAAAGLRREP